MNVRVTILLAAVVATAVTSSGYTQNFNAVTIAAGSGSGQIGLSRAPNEQCIGPTAIAPLSGARLALLDGINRKILVVGNAGMEEVPLPGAMVEPTDLTATTKGFVVADALGQVAALGSDGTVLAIKRTAYDPAWGAPRLVALRGNRLVLEDLRGNQTPSGLDSSEVGEFVDTGWVASGEYERASADTNNIALVDQDRTDALASIAISSPVRIVDARPMWVETGKGAVIAVQESRRLPVEASFVRIVIIGPDGQAQSEAYLSPAAYACDLRRPFTRLTDGTVVSVQMTDGDSIRVAPLQFVPIGTAAPLAVSVSANASLISQDNDVLAALERLNGTDTTQSIALSAIARDTILERARAALKLRWHLSPANYLAPDTANKCNPIANIWKRPPRLDNLQDQEVEAVPYRWGGYFNDLAAFQSHLAAGRLAGDVCTCRDANCVHPRATGLDCSGFISYAWRTGNYFTTRSLPGPRVSRRLRWDEVAPGDIVNDAGSHVRLVESVVSGPRGRIVTVIESATKLSCGGICRQSYSESELRNSGYVPLRRLAVTN